MKYIIENATTNMYGREVNNTYLIGDSKVLYKSNHFTQYNHMRLNTDQFIITPGHVMLDFNVIHITNFKEIKERMKTLQQIGCTTFITACEVEYESELRFKLKKAKHSLINSCIDYVVGVKVPLTSLTRTFVRKCCKYQVPILFVEINDISDMYTIDWQSIREELFPYRIFIVPIWNLTISKWNLKKLKTDWNQILTTNKIVTIVDVPIEHTPLSKRFLYNIGLFPKKGSLQINCDADYLLFFKERFNNGSDVAQLDNPEVVFANGIIKKAGDEIVIRPGIGKEIVVKVPNKFIPISHAFQPEPVFIDYY